MINSHLASDPIAALWQSARAMLADVLRVFGRPTLIAHFAGEAFKRRVRLLESLVMKLLLIEAARLAPRVPSASSRPVPPASSRQSSPEQPEDDVRAFVPRRAQDAGGTPALRRRENPSDSSTWRVRFRPRLPRYAHTTPASRTPPASRAPNPIAHARRLARRFEALARVIADPRRAIAALARKLAALRGDAYAAACAIARFMPRGAGGMAHADALVEAGFAITNYRNSS